MADKNVVEKALKSFSDTTGGYWSKNNAEYEATNPSFLSRIGRTLNPYTGPGSAMGAAYDAGNEGSLSGIGLSMLQGLPALGSLKVVGEMGPLAKEMAYRSMVDWGKTASRTAGAATLSAGVDAAQANNTGVMSPLEQQIERATLQQRIGLPLPDRATAEANAKAAQEYQARHAAELNLLRRDRTPEMIESLKKAGLPYK